MPRKTTKVAKVAKEKPPIKESIKTTTSKFGLVNLIAIILLVGVIGLVGVFLDNRNKANKPTQAVAAAQSISYYCNEGQTALDVLKANNDVKSQDSSLGVFVEGINGTENNGGSFWIYYVNGEIGQVGPAQYNCKAGDKIEWRFEQLM